MHEDTVQLNVIEPVDGATDVSTMPPPELPSTTPARSIESVRPKRIAVLGCGVPEPSLTVTVNGRLSPFFATGAPLSASMSLEVSSIDKSRRFARQSCAVAVLALVVSVLLSLSLTY
ncbi:Uncharacterised protein [Salmonella enterica subsp. enterica serovar Bovismorbificans]|uniref:Uncharacterized protein n=1 Tax=Salmonella enterica subsp. enterica serovar Bovismorbificans TaxID=58097 RepID=A0A655EGH4_SALET|nr:Uncharacterised protein [Salmonella enterica subsp. enterica serovar Bovismorbificans]CNV20495.1 Uncharacterised protein [Salmonella enterica subsp. enterica serovar Bovismorbificans]CNV33683.1 Uncharacterised protein [Salmonella enterica subsp. enterica serovar Bovismorbificans]CPR59433.1 Uncharacterised protein [Salmonella enterica subsp. enterica serovar Bovismorbificans]CPR77436.1 Uncharacterised protein [Salmonella enterica subsp. enterica serovar Bovismorbificans]